MEATETIRLDSSEGYAPSREHQYQKYCSVNTFESIAYHEKWANFWKVAGVVALVAGRILLVGAVAAVAIFVAPGIAIPLGVAALVGGIIILRRVFYEGFENKDLGISFGVIPWKGKADDHRKAAEIDKGVAEMAKRALTKSSTLTKGQANLVGRIWYWRDVADKTKAKLDAVQENIATIAQEYDEKRNTGASPEELRLISNRLSSNKIAAYQLKAAEYIPAKVKAAYVLHVWNNPTETREYTEIVTSHIQSFRTEQDHQGESSPIFFRTVSDDVGTNWSIDQLYKNDYETISKDFFSKTIIVA